MTDPPKAPERIYIDPTNMKAGFWWTDGEEGEIEYLRSDLVEKELREAHRWGYREGYADKSNGFDSLLEESFANFFVTRKEK